MNTTTATAIVLAAGLALAACAQLQQAQDAARTVIVGAMDRACNQSLVTRQAEYEAFGDKRLLPFDCNGDGQPDF